MIRFELLPPTTWTSLALPPLALPPLALPPLALPPRYPPLALAPHLPPLILRFDEEDELQNMKRR